MSTYILLVLGGLFLALFLLFRTKEGGLLPASLKTVTSFLFVATAVSGAISISTSGSETKGRFCSF